MNKRLLKLAEIERRLGEMAEGAPSEVAALLRLRRSNLSPEALTRLENRLGERLPREFATLILTYDFGSLAIGGVSFGHEGRYDEFLLKQNLLDPHVELELPWWGVGDRPKNLLLIAGTDGYVVLLEVNGGGVSAYLRDSQWTSRHIVATDFETFIRAAATIYLEPEARREEQMKGELTKLVGANPACSFWKQY